ncbi:phosphatidylglycerol/phosphatidylinositol transfer protein [Tirmania nivea]|nr:phosphatidylglycerol/phosphatidylinositol transfer protein [Tirmania nivea]
MKYLTVLLAALSTTASAATIGQFWDQSPLGVSGTGSRVPGQSPLMFCGPTDKDILEIKYVDISPNPPKPGVTLLIKASGTLKEPIEKGAYVVIEVKYGYIKLVHQNIDICEHAGEVDLECPVKPGEIIMQKEIELPKAIPPGKYHVMADVYTKDDVPITCLLADVFFHPGKPGFS